MSICSNATTPISFWPIHRGKRHFSNVKISLFSIPYNISPKLTALATNLQEKHTSFQTNGPWMPASFLELLSVPILEKKKKFTSLLPPTSWNKKEVNLLGHELLEKNYQKAFVKLTQELEIWKPKHSKNIKHAEGVRDLLNTLPHTHTGPFRSDLPEQNHFMFCLLCPIFWSPIK